MKCAVLGASTNPERYAYLAIQKLVQYNHEVVAYGLRAGNVSGIDIKTDMSPVEGIDTVSLYVGPKNQDAWEELILALKPERVIFNPGTENPALYKMLQEHGIRSIEACTLVLLSIGNFETA